MIVIGAVKHWYSTEQILKYSRYYNLIIEKGLIDKINKSLSYNIRAINKRICNHYLKPTSNYKRIIKLNFKNRYHISMTEKYSSIHLRVGDADKQPFQKYISKIEIKLLINTLKSYSNNKTILISDSQLVKIKLKKEVGNIIYTDLNLPCHSKNIYCINESINDIMMMSNSESLILTRGSTFSLFGSYFSKCSNEKIIFIGHDYEHKNYYK